MAMTMSEAAPPAAAAGDGEGGGGEAAAASKAGGGGFGDGDGGGGGGEGATSGTTVEWPGRPPCCAPGAVGHPPRVAVEEVRVVSSGATLCAGLGEEERPVAADADG